jgi:DNA-binding NarL/FixJ family response regulator
MMSADGPGVTKVLLADDHRIVLDGLRAVVERQEGFEVVGLATTGHEAVRLARRLAPDVVIMDVVMPDLNGIEATRQILAERPETRLIALSMHADRRYVREMLAAGVRGYLLKDCAAEELARAIRAVLGGQVWLSPAVAGIVVDDYTHGGNRDAPGAFALLTPREREVLQLVAEGRSAREIGAHLHLSVKTVETHRRQIMEKLGLHSVAELTRYAIREGLTPL